MSKNRAMPKTLKEVVQEYLEKGWSWRLTGGGHFQFKHPSGRGMVTVSQTPSCPRAYNNIRADFRRVERQLQTQGN